MEWKSVLAIMFVLILAACQPAPPVVPDVPEVPEPVITVPTEMGVTRVMPAEVNAGATFQHKIYVNLEAGQTYYLFDEGVPAEFEVSAEHDSKNHIKEIVIEGAVNKVYEYSLKAPMSPGTYTFDGEYAIEGKELAKIAGPTTLIVK